MKKYTIYQIIICVFILCTFINSLIKAQGSIDYKELFIKDLIDPIPEEALSDQIHICDGSLCLTWNYSIEHDSILQIDVKKESIKNRKKDFHKALEHVIERLDSNINTVVLLKSRIKTAHEHLENIMHKHQDKMSQFLLFIGKLEILRLKLGLTQKDLLDFTIKLKQENYNEKQSIDEIKIMLKSFSNKYNKSAQALKKLIQKIEATEKSIKYKIDSINEVSKTKNKESTFAVQPEKLLPSESLLPNLSVVGYSKLSNRWVNEVGYMTGNASAGNLDNYNELLIPETSRHVISIKGLTAINEGANKLNLLYRMLYQNKDLNLNPGVDTILSTVDLMQLSVGLEYTIFKDLISVYFNSNIILPLNFKNQFQNTFGFQRSYGSHFDGGLKLFITPFGDNTDGNKLFLNLNLLRLPQEIKNLNSDNAELAPSVKISFTKALSK